MKKIIVVGGGPSGMMAAISSKEHWPHAHVMLIERNEKLGKKLRLTGGGRCNVTADVSVDEVIKYVPKNGKFLYSALNNFNPQDIQKFFADNECELKMEDHYRMFPASNKSQSIVEALQRRLDTLKVEICLHSFVESVDTSKQEIVMNGKTIAYDAIIFATGSRTLSGTGSDGNGYGLAEAVGHTITELLPAEVPLVSNELFIQEKTLQGLSFHDVTLSVLQGKKVKKAITHDLLITHFGLSGPAALRGSFYIQQVLPKETPARIQIDFLPSISIDQLMQSESLDEMLLEQGIQKRLLAYFNERATNKNELIDLVKRFPMTIYETRGFSHAFVTNGGVSLKEIDPKTMKSKIDSHVSFVGELMDYNAFTGGFNITSAFATGYTAGQYALQDNA
ncbi:aminoacetone oxidase family FAD-binding enzyme [Erysipelothrix sp. HDW6C]|uniref:NAD(P)/FAD-dependent oxidoreductase n=1 Tax=Erysipelothrix sp. HDW6C TaxID=2714930 RepID=UPI0014082F35|nr:NAD(P)/FAD-dependent oxidoreductase [Erysipelothrix sp. HDW6C]QIK69750.1 aminoacetone oxidase family FAD-binding enzyme [Erysipelothrix sp. HDW6C]